MHINVTLTTLPSMCHFFPATKTFFRQKLLQKYFQTFCHLAVSNPLTFIRFHTLYFLIMEGWKLHLVTLLFVIASLEQI